MYTNKSAPMHAATIIYPLKLAVAAAFLIFFLAVALLAQQNSESTPQVSYKEVQAIFDANCASCHDKTTNSGKLSLESYEDLMKGGTKGNQIVPGESAKSYLVMRIEGTIAPRMPLGGPPLKPEEIKVIRAWINAGAKPPGAAPTEPAEIGAAKGQPLVGVGTEPPNRTAPAALTAVRAPASLPPIKPLAAVPAPVTALAFRPDGQVVAAGDYKEVRIIDSHRHSIVQKLRGPVSAIRALCYSPDGKRLAASGGEPAQFGEITIWDTQTGTLLHNLKGHKDYIYSIAFSPEGRLLATSSYDRLIKLWDVEKGVEVKTLKDHVDAVYPVAFSPDGKLLVSGSADRSVKIWDVATGRRLFTLSDSTDAIYTLAFHPSGKRIAAAGADKVIRTWEITEKDGMLSHSVIAHDDEIIQIAYSPNGSVLASTSADRTIKLWDIETGRTLKTLEKQSDWAQSIAFSPDGKTLVVGRYDGSVSLYDTGTGKLLANR